MFEGTFNFQAEARPIEQRPKYRDSRAPNGPCMITVDPRVYRGSTFRRNLPSNEETQPPLKIKKKQAPQKSRALEHGPNNFPIAPPKRIDLQTETERYLQEVWVKPQLIEIETQSDAFLDRPSTPPFVPQKNGIDIEVQVEEDQLFSFDFEVKPIVSTIVAKIIEQSFMEVHEEVELEHINEHKLAIEHRRNVELADIQRLEEGEKRKFEEKQKRLQERARVEQAQNILRAKIASRGYAEFVCSDLVSQAISFLEIDGYFYDEIEREIHDSFLPWLSDEIRKVSDEKAFEDAIQKAVQKETIRREESLIQYVVDYTTQETQTEEEIHTKLLRLMVIEDIAGQKINTNLREYNKKHATKVHEEDEAE